MATSKFSAQHYNAIAKDIREELTQWTDMFEHDKTKAEKSLDQIGIKAITELMLRFAKRFEQDYPGRAVNICISCKQEVGTPMVSSDTCFTEGCHTDLREKHNVEQKMVGGFNPLKFLDACSPNEDLYPLSELWESYNGS